MDPKSYKNPNGQFVRISERDGYAFVPHSLPPKIPYDDTLISLTASASLALGELSGLGETLQNPNLLIIPYMRQEAVLSSKIENTRSTLDDLFLFEMNDSEESRPPDVREVRNYLRAMEYGFSQIENTPLSLRFVRELHRILLSDVRGQDRRPGDFRNGQVFIGSDQDIRKALYVPPPVLEMKSALEQWEVFLHYSAQLPPLIQSALIHYQFEAIHPFNDGNGRIGRLLISIFLLHRGCMKRPLLFLSKYFERTRQEYYLRLQKVSEASDWYGWLNYYLRGVEEQSRMNIENAHKLLALQIDYRRRSESISLPARALKVVDSLFENPFLQTANVEKMLGVKHPTAQSYIDKMVSIGILKEITGKSRNRIYFAHELQRLLQE
ncbi:MAG TPA: Fic family protein [bacterium]|jgi:Fic family protein